MPSMMEIYQKHNREYDELVSAEDYQGNLNALLHRLNDFTGQTVAEFGCGTGRLTEMFAGQAAEVYCFDRSQHMIDGAQNNLEQHRGKLHFAVLDHMKPHKFHFQADTVIEGWAFGHALFEDGGDNRKTIASLVDNCTRLVRPGGTIIIIETMGTMTEEPAAPGETLGAFYRALEEDYGFSPHVLQTDYRFASIDEAARICGFFFGDSMADEIRTRGSAVVPEFTGVWMRKEGMNNNSRSIA